MNIEIGAKIKEIRKEQNISIAILSEKSGVSPGMISQIERNAVVPSVVILWKIVNALGKSLSYFFGEENLSTDVIVVKKDNYKTMFADNMNAKYELLSVKDNREIELVKVTLFSGASTHGNGFTTHGGEECGYIIKGKMIVKMPDREYFLEEGDSIYFDSSIPHRYVNLSDGDCISIWSEKPFTW